MGSAGARSPAATGNLATEDLHYLLEGSGVPPPGLDPEVHHDDTRWLGEQFGHQIPGQQSRAGTFPT